MPHGPLQSVFNWLIPSSPAGGGLSKGWLLVGRVKAAMLVATTLLAMVACVLIRPLFAGIAADQGVKLEGFGAFYMAYPWVGSLLGIPALASCVPLIRGTDRTILWMTIATLLVLLPFGFLLGGFLSVVVPVYANAGL